MEKRDEFLLTMYSKMWENIDRHIHVVWQSVGVLAGSITALVLAEKELFPLDYAVALVILVGIWQIAHVLDASWWFNRNLHIIRNIERQFMNSSDAEQIHYYFAGDPKASMLDHQKIQFGFGIAVTGMVLIYHFTKRVFPGIDSSFSNFDPERALPYLILMGGLIVLWKFHNGHLKAFTALKNKSPGRNL